MAGGRRRTKKNVLGPLETLEGRELMSYGVHALARHPVPLRALFYQENNLVSNIAGRAPVTDANLINPWGIAFKPTSAGSAGGPFWLTDNGKGVSTLYKGDGTKQPLTVKIPAPAGSLAGATSAPTGIVFNGVATDFLLGGAGTSSHFVFATEDGTIAGWNAGTNAVVKVDNSAKGAVYKGLALASTGGASYLYATNFHDGKVEVYDRKFNLVNSFTDPRIPAGYAPFGIETLRGVVVVTYAKQKLPDKHDDLAGRGNGYIDAFDPSGHLLTRIASRGRLNSPWGLATVADFGRFSNDLLVGDFGDGRINAYRMIVGRRGRVVFRFDGQLTDASRRPITIDGLWGIKAGDGASGAASNTLYFAAGPNGEKDGLFGSLTPATRR
ncbi:MAG: TIGR03118 family protein [Isosphaeraceae bacterium]